MFVITLLVCSSNAKVQNNYIMFEYFALKNVKKQNKNGTMLQAHRPEKTNITKRIMYLIVFQLKTNFP